MEHSRATTLAFHDERHQVTLLQVKLDYGTRSTWMWVCTQIYLHAFAQGTTSKRPS